MNAVVLAVIIVLVFVSVAFLHFAYFVQQSAKPYEEPSVLCFAQATRGNYTWQNYILLTKGGQAVTAYVGPCTTNGTHVIYLAPQYP